MNDETLDSLDIPEMEKESVRFTVDGLSSSSEDEDDRVQDNPIARIGNAN